MFLLVELLSFIVLVVFVGGYKWELYFHGNLLVTIILAYRYETDIDKYFIGLLLEVDHWWFLGHQNNYCVVTVYIKTND